MLAVNVLSRALDMFGVLFKSTKSVEAVAREFEAVLTQRIVSAWRGSGRSSFAADMKSLLKEYLRDVYVAGMAAGGLDEQDLTPEDEGIISDYAAQQIGSVPGFTDAVLAARDDATLQDGVMARVPLWTQAVRALGDAGAASADPNQMVEFRLRPGRKASEESCATCQELLGKRMRWRDVAKQGLMVMPGNDNYECGGWRCPHGWFPVRG